jgi:NAD-dependent dihydropyrimidine dehydrogenase PreA subunit
VITIRAERCSGCGACVDVCPTGALYLVDGKAAVDEALCNTCKECLAVCPGEAITLAPQEELVRVPALHPALQARPTLQARPEPEVIQVRTQPVSLRARVLPVAGAALAWAGREFLPRLADLLLDTLDRRTSTPQTMGARAAPGREPAPRGAKGTGKQHRHRRRGGRG